jgi:hypothetical protein
MHLTRGARRLSAVRRPGRRQEGESMKRYPVADMKNIHILGRTTRSEEGLNLFWTGSGIEVNAAGTELYVELTAGFDWFEPWIEILIDGAFSQRRMLEKGRQRICVFRAVERGAVRNVQILKATQAAGGDPASFLQINALVSDGVFLPVEPCAMKLEVIGDSLTSGEGSLAPRGNDEWISLWFSARGNYSWVACDELNAERSILSQSGWGVCWDWEHNPSHTLPAHYEEIAGVLRGPAAESRGCTKPWDFASWQPDVVCIRLGTNDNNGINVKNSLDTDKEVFIRGALAFLRLVRQKNPPAKIVWILPASDCRPELPAEAVRRAKEEGLENLFTFTKYWGFDPEISSNSKSLGVDRGIYPQARTWTVGFNLAF